MAEGLNKVILMGNLGAEPELRVTAGGEAILKMRLATTEVYLDRTNTRQERTEWHSVTMWGKRGEALAKVLSKGSSVLIEGSLRTYSYEKGNEKRYRTEVIANRLVFVGSKGRSAPPDQEEGARMDTSNSHLKHTPPSSDADFDDFGAPHGGFGEQDEDIPF
ncbi:single-stranded DNA-binding protein [Pajaroellobacter abortibovis]|uniref:Single-stranded DNA-binding protein n=1 Tax=Pajaroellobacter abortibovis TaxID=1882918 RepID=A0A1L6MVM6_9BACT|nr:single-stranded DNA-binding protein [Pajaroellobacter abortibovis]APR99561.1 hypothetical protein BCY86_01850 [Pajaroellobacter abortibovis]